jgi:hypothetical protein
MDWITRPIVGPRAVAIFLSLGKESAMNTWIFVSTLAAVLAGRSPEAPRWTADYAVALAATKTTERPLLVVINDPWRTDVRLEQVSSSTDKTQAELLASFQLCRIDAKTPYGRQTAESFKVQEYPFAAIIDRTGSVILHQQSGPVTAQEWSAMLARHRSGVYTPQRQVAVARTVCIT